MATFNQNIETIRTTGVKGTVIRAAVAEALEQAGDDLDSKISSARANINLQILNAQAGIRTQISQAVVTMNEQVSEAQGDMDNALAAVKNEVENEISSISEKVDNRNIYMTATEIAGRVDEYLLTIENPI